MKEHIYWKLNLSFTAFGIILLVTGCFRSHAAKLALAAKVTKFMSVEELKVDYSKLKGEIVGVRGHLLVSAYTTIRSADDNTILFLDLEKLPRDTQLDLRKKCAHGSGCPVMLVGEVTTVEMVQEGIVPLQTKY